MNINMKTHAYLWAHQDTAAETCWLRFQAHREAFLREIKHLAEDCGVPGFTGEVTYWPFGGAAIGFEAKPEGWKASVAYGFYVPYKRGPLGALRRTLDATEGPSGRLLLKMMFGRYYEARCPGNIFAWGMSTHEIAGEPVFVLRRPLLDVIKADPDHVWPDGLYELGLSDLARLHEREAEGV